MENKKILRLEKYCIAMIKKITFMGRERICQSSCDLNIFERVYSSDRNTIHFSSTWLSLTGSHRLFSFDFFINCVYIGTTKETSLFSLFRFTFSKKPTQRQFHLVGRPRKKRYQGIHQLGLQHCTVKIDVLLRFNTNFL